MDIKVVNLQKNKVAKLSTFTNEEEDKYLSQFLQSALGLKIIVKNYCLSTYINDKVDFLCIDESYRLVIVEKRSEKNTRVIRSALMYIDYIKEHLAEIKLLISDKMGPDILKDICYDCRLVLLTKSFSCFDFSSIKNLPYTIEAINYMFLDNSLVFVKEYQNNRKDYKNYRFEFNHLYYQLEELLLSLGDDVCFFGNGNVVSVRKIKTFMYVINNIDNIIIYLNNKQYIINNEKDLLKLEDKIEKAYDEN